MGEWAVVQKDDVSSFGGNSVNFSEPKRVDAGLITYAESKNKEAEQQSA
jgi:hypothetical protein